MHFDPLLESVASNSEPAGVISGGGWKNPNGKLRASGCSLLAVLFAAAAVYYQGGSIFLFAVPSGLLLFSGIILFRIEAAASVAELPTGCWDLRNLHISEQNANQRPGGLADFRIQD
jgi:hypothetical protein